jgi:hypothetical protein
MKNKYLFRGFLEEERKRPWGVVFGVFFNPGNPETQGFSPGLRKTVNRNHEEWKTFTRNQNSGGWKTVIETNTMGYGKR